MKRGFSRNKDGGKHESGVNASRNRLKSSERPPSPSKESDFLAAARKRKLQSKGNEKEINIPLLVDQPDEKNPYLVSTRSSRKRRDLSFNEPGTYIKSAEFTRSIEKMSPIRRTFVVDHRPPSAEWWDEQVEASPDVASIEKRLPVWQQFMPESDKVYLTPLEQRKKRRNERVARTMEAREREKLGGPTDSGRKSASFTAGEYLRDPTKYDQISREARDERKRLHEEANEARKVSADERWEIQMDKLKARREELGVHRSVYQIDSVDPKNRAVIDQAANRFLATGCLMITENITILIWESSEKEMRKLAKLMGRLDWNHQLVWEGPATPAFSRWSILEKNKQGAYEFLMQHNSWAYYKLAQQLQ